MVGLAVTVVGTVPSADAAVAGAPSAPLSVSAHADVNAAKVYWQAPADSGDSPITGYTATASPGGHTCSTGSSGRSCKVTGLSNGASYTFTVTATNGAGTSAPSSPSNPVTPAVDTTEPVLVSSSVTPTRVSSATGGNVTVELRITDDLSGIRTPSGGFDANPAIIFNRTDDTGSGIGFTRTMTRISGDEYDGIYRATTNIPAGTSPGSWDLTVYPIDDNAGNSTFFIDRPGIMVGTPAAPTGVTASAAPNRDVTISWNAADDGGNVITQYRVSGTGGKTFTTSGATILTTSAYANWPRDTPVSFTVVAINGAGTSPTSTASAPLTIPATAPSAPSLTAAAGGNTSVAGTWTAPASTGGDAALTYTLAAAPGGATCTTTALSCTIGGLTNGQQYSLTVVATNSAGTSPESNSRIATPATVPAAPAAPQVLVAGSNLNVTWTAPADDGGAAVTSYTATARSGATVGDTCTTSTLGCALTVPDGNWTVEVVAANPVGAGPASPASAPVRVDTQGPTVTLISAPAWAPVLTGTSKVNWTGDDVSGVTSYKVQLREAPAGAPFGAWANTTQTETSVNLAIKAGRTVCVRIAGVDEAGNTSVYTHQLCRTSPVDDRAGGTSGKTKRVTGAQYFTSTATMLTATGAQLKFTGVRASAATLVATTCSNCGKVQVLYGTKVVKTVSLMSDRTVNKKLVTLPAVGRTTTITLRSRTDRKVILDGLVLRAR